MTYPRLNYTLGEPMPRPLSMNTPPINKPRRKTQSGVPAIPLKDKT